MEIRRFLPSFSRAVPVQEARGLGWPDNTRPPNWADVSSGPGYSPLPVTRESAYGLPAVSAAVRLVAQTIGALPLMVYRGDGADKRAARDSWQFGLLHDLPGTGDFTPMDFLSDVAACLETSGNAFIQKVKAARTVIALIVIDPQRVQVKRENGEKVFLVRDSEGRDKTYTAAEIIHIRGFTVNGSDTGISPISVHRQTIGTMSAQEQYSARFYGQGTHVGLVIETDKQPSIEEAREIKERFSAGHGGLRNSHLPLVLFNGATVKRIGMTLEDAQFVESEKLSLVQAAHVFGIPPSFLTGENQSNPEQDSIRFLTFSLMPRLRRIELALYADPDLFPDRALYPEFDTSGLLRTDAKTAAEVEHIRIQDGTLLADEGRADRGMGPLPPIPDDPTQEPGKVPQLTPVGGAPNPNVTDANP